MYVWIGHEIIIANQYLPVRGEVERGVDFVNEITSCDVTGTRTEEREVLILFLFIQS